METPVTQYKVKLRKSDEEVSNQPQPQEISEIKSINGSLGSAISRIKVGKGYRSFIYNKYVSRRIKDVKVNLSKYRKLHNNVKCFICVSTKTML